MWKCWTLDVDLYLVTMELMVKQKGKMMNPDAKTCLPAREVSSKASLFDTMEKKSCSETGQS